MLKNYISMSADSAHQKVHGKESVVIKPSSQ